jgi:hypothetical protein
MYLGFTPAIRAWWLRSRIYACEQKIEALRAHLKNAPIRQSDFRTITQIQRLRDRQISYMQKLGAVR